MENFKISTTFKAASIMQFRPFSRENGDKNRKWIQGGASFC